MARFQRSNTHLLPKLIQIAIRIPLDAALHGMVRCRSWHFREGAHWESLLCMAEYDAQNMQYVHTHATRMLAHCRTHLQREQVHGCCRLQQPPERRSRPLQPANGTDVL